MKNKIQNLTDHLFAQLERLSDEELVDGALRDEIARAGAVTSVAREIIAAGALVVKARQSLGDLPPDNARIRLLGLDE